jgi:hypothetical protein
MSIEINKQQFGIEFPQAVSKAVWINVNGHGSSFTAEIQVKTWKDQATKDGVQKTVKDEDGKESVITVPGESFPLESFVPEMTPENKADLDIIRAAAYRMLHREERFKDGKAV